MKYIPITQNKVYCPKNLSKVFVYQACKKCVYWEGTKEINYNWCVCCMIEDRQKTKIT